MGYLKINRDLCGTDVFFDDQLLAFYIRLLFKCRVVKHREGAILVDRGQYFTSVRRLASDFDLCYSITLKYLKTLERNQLISITTYSKGSLITAIDFDCVYEKKENQNQSEKLFSKNKKITSGGSTLLYNKKNVMNGVSAARMQSQKTEFFSEDGSVTSENSEKNCGNNCEKDCGNNLINIANNTSDPQKKEEPGKLDLLYPTRESLVEKYGEDNVFDYECRFERWKSRQKKYVNITCYDAIERWMRDDHVQKKLSKPSEAGYNTDDIMQRIINSYNN